MKITFKEVGQGDTIIIEWKQKGEKKIGIIDSNIKDSLLNPALIFLQNSAYQSIEFLALSHPHYDHFSGFNDILNYCDNHSIQIKYFLHTSSQVPEFLQSAVRGHVAKKELEKLFENIQRLFLKKRIMDCFYVTNNSREIILNSKWSMRFISPSHKEITEYTKNMYKDYSDLSQNNSYANILSTVIEVYSQKDKIILTSDTVRAVFKKLDKVKSKNNSLKLILSQISHHGALGNFHRNFWKQHSYDQDTPAVISVGENSYGHPSQEVIFDLKKMKFEVYATNNFINLNPLNSSSISNSLDSISTIVSTSVSSNSSKDIIFDANKLTVI